MLKVAHNCIIIVLLILCNIQNITAQELTTQESTIKSVGDVFLIAIPATALGTTLVLGDKKGTWQFTKAFLLNQAITFGLKKAINKERPDASNTDSFPSGHTSTVFQGASFIHMRYGFKYSVPAYLAAGFTAFSRIRANKHDGYDVLVGAMIGIGSTYIFTTPYQKEHLELTYSKLKENHLIGFKFKF